MCWLSQFRWLAALKRALVSGSSAKNGARPQFGRGSPRGFRAAEAPVEFQDRGTFIPSRLGILGTLGGRSIVICSKGDGNRGNCGNSRSKFMI